VLGRLYHFHRTLEDLVVLALLLLQTTLEEAPAVVELAQLSLVADERVLKEVVRQGRLQREVVAPLHIFDLPGYSLRNVRRLPHHGGVVLYREFEFARVVQGDLARLSVEDPRGSRRPALRGAQVTGLSDVLNELDRRVHDPSKAGIKRGERRTIIRKCIHGLSLIFMASIIIVWFFIGGAQP